MSENCIVCLLDLPLHHHRPSASPSNRESEHVTSLPIRVNGPVKEEAASHVSAALAPSGPEGELIANLIPCRHFLHDECLKPWVERANSCPICRAKFNKVELSESVGGPISSSYDVQDKEQSPEIDPSLIVDIDEDPLNETIEPCTVCEEYGDEATLLLCDGCNQSCHLFCCGLDEIPAGNWFCFTCQQDPQVMSRNRLRNVSASITRPRDRVQAHRQRHGGPRSLAWERVWRSVFDRIELDLDFPFENEERHASEDQQSALERLELREWQNRFRVASRQGAASRFRDTARVLHERPEQNADAQAENNAWSAFDRARDTNGQTLSRRKRKSRTSSPHRNPPVEPERKLKRPRTHRVQEAEGAENVAESSRSAARQENVPAPRPRRDRELQNGNPTFLQSLLDEVQAHPSAAYSDDEVYRDQYCNDFGPAGTERSISPDASPVASNHGTPRSTTPPPYGPVSPTARPGSPMTLTSNISPVFPPAPEFSASASMLQDSIEEARARSRQRNSTRQSPASSPTRNRSMAQPSSPGPYSPAGQSASENEQRNATSYKAKSDIQQLVKQALKPFYRSQEISSEEYTQINREVSRYLYDKIGLDNGLIDKERWQPEADDVVGRTIKARKKDKTGEPAKGPDQTSTLPVVGEAAAA